MARKKWVVIPGGRIKRWKKSESESGCWFSHRVPPHWYRNHLNRRERRRSKQAMFRGREYGHPHVHPREAGWYW